MVAFGHPPRDLHVLFHLHSGQRIEQHHSEEVFTHVAGDRVLFSDVGAQAGAISEEAEQNGPAQVRQPALQNLQDFKEEPAIEQHSKEQQGRKATTAVDVSGRAAHRPPGSHNGEHQAGEPFRGEPSQHLEHPNLESRAVGITLAGVDPDRSPNCHAEEGEEDGVEQPYNNRDCLQRDQRIGATRVQEGCGAGPLGHGPEDALGDWCLGVAVGRDRVDHQRSAV